MSGIGSFDRPDALGRLNMRRWNDAVERLDGLNVCICGRAYVPTYAARCPSCRQGA